MCARTCGMLGNARVHAGTDSIAVAQPNAIAGTGRGLTVTVKLGIHRDRLDVCADHDCGTDEL